MTTIICSSVGATVLHLLDFEVTIHEFSNTAPCYTPGTHVKESRRPGPPGDEGDTRMDPSDFVWQEKLRVTPEEWQEWLLTSAISKGVKKFDTDISESGCGVSAKVRFNTTTSKPLSGFFKYNDEAKGFLYHIDAESHFQEIKAAHFDKILQTNIVPPVVGYEFKPFETLRAERSKTELNQHMTCRSKSNNSFRNTGIIRGSMMLWVDGVAAIEDRNEIVKAALLKQDENAIRYAVFHYLAACGKTDHNHFSLCTGGESDDCSDSEASKFYVALDNDRCFQPTRVQEYIPGPMQEYSERHYKKSYNNRLAIWKYVAFNTCAFPRDLAGIILDTAEGKLPPISKRLQNSLQMDILADDILALHPESYHEIDERVRALAMHIRGCKAGVSQS